MAKPPVPTQQQFQQSYLQVLNFSKQRILVTIQNRSERNRVDREKMIQECKNPIVEDDFHGFLHRNCEGTEQLRILIIQRPLRQFIYCQIKEPF